MDLDLSGPRQIGDEELADAAPRVRALVLERLEQVWATCAPHVDGTLARAGERVDPRFVEAGIRVLDRLAKLYRLDSPQVTETRVDSVVDPVALVEAQLAEISARMGF